MNTESAHVYFPYAYKLQSEREEESKRQFFHDTRNEVITILLPNTPSNHTLGQDILLVATP